MLDTEKTHIHNASFAEQKLKGPQYEIICTSISIYQAKLE